MDKKYLCIDLKSFYASVECMERGLDPMTTNLVVADTSRTEKTICLAVSPSLKSFGIPGRPRLFEVVQIVKNVNMDRRRKINYKPFSEKSHDYNTIMNNPFSEVDYIVAPPRMAHYMEYSTKIYEIYLKYIAPEDIHVYSIDEVFMDITNYLKVLDKTPRELAMTIIKDVLSQTGITATAGIGTNMYLAKVAMDIVAKHTKADKDGVRIAELDEMSYRQKLWTHTPITDFWRVGKGYGKKLNDAGIFTMGDIARESLTLYGENRLFKLFGVNAELLIDHAWGVEPCTMEDIRSYTPDTKSIGSGQVLSCPYTYEKAEIIVKEMTEALVLDLVDKSLVTKQLVLTVGYDVENLKGGGYFGEITTDMYGRKIPKHAHGTVNLKCETSSTKLITEAVLGLYKKITDRSLLIRRVNISANNVVSENVAQARQKNEHEQYDLFTDYEKLEKDRESEREFLEKEKRIQKTMLNLKKQYGKNAIIKGMNLQEGATAMERNSQIGGHKA